MSNQPQEPFAVFKPERHNVFPAIIGLVCFAIGYFVGREHVKYEMRSSLQQAFSGISSSVPTAQQTQEPKSSPRNEEDLYIPFVEPYDIQAGRVSSSAWMDANKPRIDGKIRNKGTRTLKSLVLRFYYADADGKIVFEDTDKESYGFEGLMGETVPLFKPGYVVEFFHLCKACPSEASAKPTKIEVAAVEFAD